MSEADSKSFEELTISDDQPMSSDTKPISIIVIGTCERTHEFKSTFSI